MRSHEYRVAAFASMVFVSLLARQASAADRDWGGADLTISANTTMDGVQSNIGTLTIQPNVTVTVTPGLALRFEARDVMISGVIDANGAGAAGGAAGATQTLIGGGGNGGMGLGGGAAGANGTSGSGSGGAGGGGGSYGGLGGRGGSGYSTCTGDRPTGGAPGAVYGSATDEIVQLGSGGGGGGGAYTNGTCTWAQNRNGAPGGRGGGAVSMVATGSLSMSGAILANGADGGLGGTAGCGGAGSGGGGSGGGVLLSGGTVSFTGAISARGGLGGGEVCAGVGCGSPTSTTCDASSVGLSGGGGRVKIFAAQVTALTGTIDVAGQNPGTVFKPAIRFDPIAVDFGDVQVSTVASAMVTVHNIGSDSFTISALQVTGSSTFSLANPPSLPQTIAAGGSLALSLAYAPTAISADTGTLALVTDIPGNPNASVPLAGQGVSGVLSASPLSIDFGSVEVGTASATMDVTITNTGNTSFDLVTATLTGTSASAFALSDVPALPVTIAPSTSVTIKVAFAPATGGPATAALHLTSNIPGGMAVNVELAGQGLQAGIGASPTSLDFGTVLVGTTSGAQTITVRNTGDAPLTISGATMTGSAAAAYAIAFTPPASPLAPGETTTLSVTFAPTTVGIAEAIVRVTSTSPGIGALDIPVTGSGADTSLSVTPLSLDFGAIEAGEQSAPQTVTITNTGSVAMTISAIVSSDAAFVLTAPALPVTLEANATVSFDVSFAPTSDGALTGTIQIDTANKPNAANVALSGTATPTGNGSGCCQTGQEIPPVAVLGVLALCCTLRPRRRRR